MCLLIVLVGPTLFSPYPHATRTGHHFSQCENTAPARDLSAAAPRRSLPVSLATRARRQTLPFPAPPTRAVGPQPRSSPSVASPISILHKGHRPKPYPDGRRRLQLVEFASVGKWPLPCSRYPRRSRPQLASTCG
jgi:hypothetical protein